jgi:hypothetical protein
MPFQLIKPDVFKHDALAGMTKEEFLKKHMGAEKFAKVEAAIAKWAEEKGVPMWVSRRTAFRGDFLT